MQGVRWTAAAVAIVWAVGSAAEARAEHFNVPAGRIGDVAGTLGEQAGITITVTDPDIATRRSPGVRGNFSVRVAVARALRGTGAEAIFYDDTTVRIVRQRTKPKARVRPSPAPPPAPSPPPSTEIVVTASKQGTLLHRYPGSVDVVEFEPDWLARNAAEGSGAIAKRLPTVTSTNLGPGRDKLFVRGIADSSFNGPTQATAGQYLGDVRLNYNAPDPDLNLYDMKRVEVLPGPQGTLYGASSLGGIIRLVPNEPDGNNTYAAASGGLGATWHGGISRDVATMINLPVSGDRVAVRAVVYGTREAGYIDDPSRGVDNINSMRSDGVRMTWRLSDLFGWTVNIGGAFQNIANRDGQYVLRGNPPLTRSNTLPQPFHNDYRLVFLTARKEIGSRELVSTTSLVRHKLLSVFDATGHDGSVSPAQFEESNDITLISHETRISGGDQSAPWVAGLAAIYNFNRITRSLGPPDALAPIADVGNLQPELSIFGQISRPVGEGLVATAGGRLTLAGSAGYLLNETSAAPEVFRNKVRFSPSFALDWHPTPTLSGFLHFQQGYRAGGLAVGTSGPEAENQRFKADNLTQIELGVRWGREGDPLSIRAALFLADWNQIQADLINDAGLPYTTNIGNGRIYGLDGEIKWRLSPDVVVRVAAFLNESTLQPEPAFAGQDDNTLPNIARDGVRLGLDAHTEISPGVTLTGNVSVRYVGKSQLGTGPLLGISQGDYVVADLGGRLAFNNFGLSLDIANLGNVRANTFAYGNPFGLHQRDQMTPLRPRTIRLGIDTRF